MSSSIEYYSMNKFINRESNILDKKLSNLIESNNMLGGGNEYNFTHGLVLLIGLIILIIGVILCLVKNDWIKTIALIENTQCSDKTNDCKQIIKYIVNSQLYTKVITTNKNNILNDSNIEVYYQESNPNIVRLNSHNYLMIGISLIILGVFAIIFTYNKK